MINNPIILNMLEQLGIMDILFHGLTKEIGFLIFFSNARSPIGREDSELGLRYNSVHPRLDILPLLNIFFSLIFFKLIFFETYFHIFLIG